MTWFHQLTGFREESAGEVRRQLSLEENRITSRVNGMSYRYGDLTTPSLSELRRLAGTQAASGKMAIREVIADVQELHLDPTNANAVFQVASQFNLLEMTGPHVTPEQGVGIYEYDHTQGPACAIAAGAGTIYRNYFVPLRDQVGQSSERQIDCLADLGKLLGNEENRLWQMTNGYALASQAGLVAINKRLRAADEAERDELRGALRIGVQQDVQVTLGGAEHLLTQVFCSALPVAYSQHDDELWEPFARLVLEAAYEATFLAARLNSARTGNSSLFLTLLGGGAFGNAPAWILDALRRAAQIHSDADLKVAVVSYGNSNSDLRRLLKELSD